VLGKTLGVPLFQEQAMKIAIVAAGFTPSEADQLRRAMATFRRAGTIHGFRDKMIQGMTARGYDAAFAERCFKQIEGFGEYGFPESHAASFALLVYVSAWLKCHYPAAFACALLNSQPMGFYAPAQIVRDARQHGVTVRPVDINHSFWDCTLEGSALARVGPGPLPLPATYQDTTVGNRAGERAGAGAIRPKHVLRLGLRQVRGLAARDAAALTTARTTGNARPFCDVEDLWRRAALGGKALERLALAGCRCSRKPARTPPSPPSPCPRWRRARR